MYFIQEKEGICYAPSQLLFGRKDQKALLSSLFRKIDGLYPKSNQSPLSMGLLTARSCVA